MYSSIGDLTTCACTHTLKDITLPTLAVYSKQFKAIVNVPLSQALRDPNYSVHLSSENIVARDIEIHEIEFFPGKKESESVMIAYGKDLLISVVYPSGQFDQIPEEFIGIQLLVFTAILIMISIFAHFYQRRKKELQNW